MTALGPVDLATFVGEPSRPLPRRILTVLFRLAPFAVLFALSETGCLCPPCQTGAGATVAAAPPAAGGNAAPPGNMAAPGPPPAAGPATDRLVIWDGDKVGAGQSWADCTKKELKCKSVLSKTAGTGANGSTGMKWHGEGPDWMGAGWNWLGWWPQDGGTDISPFKNLSFQMKVEAKSPDLAPDPDALGVGITCSNKTLKSCTTARLSPHKYVADFADGQWHKIVIPIDDLLVGEGIQFDKKVAWEFDFNEWSGAPRDFTVYVDDIAFEK